MEEDSKPFTSSCLRRKPETGPRPQSFANQLHASEGELGELAWQAMQWAQPVSSGKE